MDNLSTLKNETYNDSHRENKKVRLRQQLIDLSCSDFLYIGYEKLSLEKIAEEANVSVRTILRYFDSKAGLVTAPCKNLRVGNITLHKGYSIAVTQSYFYITFYLFAENQH